MKTRMKLTTPFAIFGLIFLGSSALAAFPNNQLKTLAGKANDFEAHKKNALVVLWATWCPDCKSKLSGDLPDLLAKQKDLEIILVNTESDTARVASYVEKQKIPFVVLQDLDKSYRKELKAFSVPHWALYQKTGDGAYSLVRSKPAFDRKEIEGLL